MNFKPWAMAPTSWIRDGRIKQFQWHADKATGTAALMVLYCCIQVARPCDPSESVLCGGTHVVHLTYDDVQALSGLSRASIASAFALLEARGMVLPLPARSRYALPGLVLGMNWAKLPGRPLLSQGGTVGAFAKFSLRSRRELDALKLFYYYCSIRDRTTVYSLSAFETIHDAIAIREADIPAANSFLLACGLLARIQQETNAKTKHREANRYFLTGYSSFLTNIASVDAAQAPPAAQN
jgi:hypothetical protein